METWRTIVLSLEVLATYIFTKIIVLRELQFQDLPSMAPMIHLCRFGPILMICIQPPSHLENVDGLTIMGKSAEQSTFGRRKSTLKIVHLQEIYLPQVQEFSMKTELFTSITLRLKIMLETYVYNFICASIFFCHYS